MLRITFFMWVVILGKMALADDPFKFPPFPIHNLPDFPGSANILPMIPGGDQKTTEAPKERKKRSPDGFEIPGFGNAAGFPGLGNLQGFFTLPNKEEATTKPSARK